MTIEERNETAMACTNLIHVIIRNNYANHDHAELFQVGFLALLRAISYFPKPILDPKQEDFSKYAATSIMREINKYLAKEDFEANLKIDCGQDKPKHNINKIKHLLNTLMHHCLTYVEENIIKLYYGFDGHARSLYDLSKIMNCSREHVRQILQKALRKLKYGNSNQRTRELKHKLLKELKGWTEK